MWHSNKPLLDRLCFKHIAFHVQTLFKRTDQLWCHTRALTSWLYIWRVGGSLLWWDRDSPVLILESTSIDFLSLCVCKNVCPIKAWDSAAGRHCLDRLLIVSTLICKQTPCLRGIFSDRTPGSDHVTQLPTLRFW